MKNDWRYDLGYNMKGLTFTFKEYKPLHQENDHDHCEFCTSKFSETIEDALKKGYQTVYTIKYKGEIRNQDSWVCKKCFHDFREVMNLNIKDSDDQ